jgi:hypothetical protein
MTPALTACRAVCSCLSFSFDALDCFQVDIDSDMVGGMPCCVVELVCEFDINSLKEKPPKGKVGWVSDAAVPCTVNLYSNLFNQCEIKSVRTDSTTPVTT